VIYVNYVGKRMHMNCAHVGQPEVSTDILDAVKWAAAQSGVGCGSYICHWLVLRRWRCPGGVECRALRTAYRKGGRLLPDCPMVRGDHWLWSSAHSRALLSSC